MTGNRTAFDRTLFWRHGAGQDAVRSGRWKYLKFNELEFLFDLTADQREQADFQKSNPDIFHGLKAEFAKWQKTVLPRPERRANDSKQESILNKRAETE